MKRNLTNTVQQQFNKKENNKLLTGKFVNLLRNNI